MPRSHILLIFVIFCLSLLMSSCGDTSNTTINPNSSANPVGTIAVKKKDKYIIGMAQTDSSDPWRVAMNAQLSAAASKYPQLQLTISDAAQSNAKQVANIDSFLQQGIDLLIVSPNEAAPLTSVVAKAYDKGIPVIVLDRKVNGNKYTTWIGANNVLIGKKAGEFVAKWCKDNNHKPCNVIELRGLEGSTPATERGDGFRAGIASNPDVKIASAQNADWLRVKALPIAQLMLQSNPNVDVVYTHNDPMTEAAYDAAKTLNKDTSKMLFVGIDGLPNAEGGIKSVINGRLNVSYVYPTGGAEAIEWAVKILEQGQLPPREIVLETEEVIKTNASDLYVKYGGK